MNKSYLNTSVLKFNGSLEDPSFGSNALILDLEDGVHTKDKGLARETLAKLDLSRVPPGTSLGVRINSVSSLDGIRDLDAVYRLVAECKAKIDFLQLPKVVNSGEVKIVRKIISSLPRKIDLMPIIEVTQGVNHVFEIAEISDLMMFGQVDMEAALYAPNESYLGYARGIFCAACATHKIPAIDTAAIRDEKSIVNLAAFETACIESKGEGFTGRAVVHPAQVEIVNRTYGVSEGELEKYRRVLENYNSADAGFSVVEGEVVAPPFVSKASIMLELYDHKI